MRRVLLVAGLVIATAAPTMAFATMRCEREAHDNRVAGTIIGGVAGGLIGSAASGGRAGGAAVGALGGAVIGNRLADAATDCPRGYVAYDDGVEPYGYDRGAPSAYDYGDDSAYSGYSNSRYWRDDRGRWCHWEDRARYDYDAYASPRWVQSCSWR